MSNKRRKISLGGSDDGDVADQQQQKICENCAKFEAELREAKQEIKTLQTELDKQKLMTENIALRAKVAKLEQEQQQKNKYGDQLRAKTGELEEKLKEMNDEFATKIEEKMETVADLQQKMIILVTQQMAQHQKQDNVIKDVDVLKEKIGNVERILQQQKEICEQMKAKHNEVVVKMEEKLKKNFADFDNAIQTKVAELDGQQKKLLDSIGILKEQFLNFQSPQNHKKKISIPQQNCWDVAACHNELTICGSDNLIVIYQGNGNGWRSVFAEYCVLHTFAAFFDCFYFEITVKNIKNSIGFGIGVKPKHLELLHRAILKINGTYAYVNYGYLWVNTSDKSGNGLKPFGKDDVVGCGVNLHTKHLFFTKNGRRIGPTNLVFSHSAHELFPFVSMCSSGDGIEANFGPNFMFNLATFR